jgi:hypothetical protein
MWRVVLLAVKNKIRKMKVGELKVTVRKTYHTFPISIFCSPCRQRVRRISTVGHETRLGVGLGWVADICGRGGENFFELIKAFTENDASCQSLTFFFCPLPAVDES